MSAPDAEESNLLAGHPPAVKVGGVRVTQSKNPSKDEKKKASAIQGSESEETDDVTAGAGDNAEEEVAVERRDDKKQSVVSGALTKERDAFPAAAQKEFQNKPVPHHDKRPAEKIHNINQPR